MIGAGFEEDRGGDMEENTDHNAHDPTVIFLQVANASGAQLRAEKVS